MSAIDRVDILVDNPGYTEIGVSKDFIKSVMNRAIWLWYDAHKDEVIIQRKVWFFTVKIRVSDLEFLIVRIAGPRGH